MQFLFAEENRDSLRDGNNYTAVLGWERLRRFAEKLINKVLLTAVCNSADNDNIEEENLI